MKVPTFNTKSMLKKGALIGVALAGLFAPLGATISAHAWGYGGYGGYGGYYRPYYYPCYYDRYWW